MTGRYLGCKQQPYDASEPLARIRSGVLLTGGIVSKALTQRIVLLHIRCWKANLLV